ncbi:sensor histidine kinase [Lachnoclostridium sp.]|uniref:sensor histidine kinase n=1 Tax=Lachnoclostridium sp. TaxID=2028282 RepID=UPI0028987D04|nr:histidine kinase [Lachnoclostridium sp.]
MKIKMEIKKYILDYKFNSLFIKNLRLLFLLLIVPIMGTVILAYYSYMNIQQNEVKSYNESIVSDTMAGIERIIKEAQTQMIYIGFNSNVELYMYDTGEIKEFNYKVKNISDMLRLPVISKDYIDSIYIHSHKSDKVVTIEGISDYSNFGEKDGLVQYYNQGESSKNRILLTNNTRKGYPKKQLSIFQNIRYGSTSTGVVVMNLKLEELIKELNIGKESHIFITDGKQILFSNDLEQIAASIDSIEGYDKLNNNSTLIYKDYCLSSKVNSDNGLEVVSYLDMSTYQNKLSTLRNVMLIFVLVMILITIGLGTIISIRIFAPIGTILAAIREYSSVLIGEEAILKEKDELMYIMNTIRKTVDKKKDVDKELSERVRLLKKAQVVALQSQINPHFLNNTLDTMNWIAIGLLGGDNEISEMTSALSKMLRMTLENTDTIIPLKTEIEHCENYLEIQKKRYENKFEVDFRIPEELYNCKTIRIILQPIIENAIYHGIKPLSNKGIIIVEGKLQDDTVELVVSDNGLGMTEEELQALNMAMKRNFIKESEHIGATNVNQRLQLYFGDEYGIVIKSLEGIGTKVTIRFPYITD